MAANRSASGRFRLLESLERQATPKAHVPLERVVHSRWVVRMTAAMKTTGGWRLVPVDGHVWWMRGGAASPVGADRADLRVAPRAIALPRRAEIVVVHGSASAALRFTRRRNGFFVGGTRPGGEPKKTRRHGLLEQRSQLVLRLGVKRFVVFISSKEWSAGCSDRATT